MPAPIEADVCIVGAGIAGLFAACTLPAGMDVVVVDKGAVGEGSTPLAQGGMAAAMAVEDSWELHLKDTVTAGAGLVNEAAAEVLAREAPDRVRDLIDLGCEFDREITGGLHLAREGGQSVARSVHRADATGAEIARALTLAAEPRIRRVEAYAFSLATSPDGPACRGVWAMGDEGLVLVRARATLLALGGAGALFESTTNNPASTGDSLAMAHEAGVRLADLEFIQFHPTALAVAQSPRPLLTEALRGAGAVLVDAGGHPIMEGVHPDGDLAPRHVVTAAILGAGQAFLDARSLGAERLEREFPTVVTSCRKYGFDPAIEPIPVTPAAHYMIGGIETDLDGRASLSGLFAAGECAATGVHGANRMAGNSLSESAVFAYRAAKVMASEPSAGMPNNDPAEPKPPAERPTPDLRRQIIEAVTLGAGPIRDAESANAALPALRALGESTDSREALAMITSGQLLIQAALAREETRGVHVRRDFPETNPALDGVHLTAAI